MSQRGEYLDKGILAPLLLRLGQHDVALEYLRSRVQVRGVESVALGTVKLLMEQGLTTEARQVLSIGEPITLPTSSMATGLPGTNVFYPHLRGWIQAAVWLHDADEIIDSIRGLRYEGDNASPVATSGPHRSLKTELLSDAGLELLREERWSDLQRLFDAFRCNWRGRRIGQIPAPCPCLSEPIQS